MTQSKSRANANPEVLNLVREFCHYKSIRGEFGPTTAVTTRRCLEVFAEWFGQRPVSELTTATAKHWYHHRLATHATTTIQVECAYLRGFARWAAREGHLPTDFARELRRIPSHRRIVYKTTRHDFDTVLAHTDDPRDQLILWLLYGSGLRCCEASQLTIEDYDATAHALYVTGKYGHQRRTPVPPPTRAAIAAYQNSIGNPRSGPLIRKRERKAALHLHPGRITVLISELMIAAGIKQTRDDGHSAHSLRVLAATELYDITKDPYLVKEFLGHARISTLVLYQLSRTATSVAEANNARFAR